MRREWIARESKASTEREGEWGRDFTARSLTWVSETRDICQALTEEKALPPPPPPPPVNPTKNVQGAASSTRGTNQTLPFGRNLRCVAYLF